MGTVYRAIRADDQYLRAVAIKLIRHGGDTPESLSRFRMERQILATLQHPNIAALLDGGTTEEGQPYLVMEYIEGEPLIQFCRSHKLGVEQRVELFRSLCSAIHYAHQSLVIHRDIKPSNILVGADGVPKLLDFGIAKLMSPELMAGEEWQTRTLQRLLTPDYGSPEQVRGEPLTTATDIYSLGILLYELLSETKRWTTIRGCAGSLRATSRILWRRQFARSRSGGMPRRRNSLRTCSGT
jgi:serine/threonine protein kinase